MKLKTILEDASDSYSHRLDSVYRAVVQYVKTVKVPEYNPPSGHRTYGMMPGSNVFVTRTPTGGYYHSSVYQVSIPGHIGSGEMKRVVDKIKRICDRWKIEVQKPIYGTSNTIVEFGNYNRLQEIEELRVKVTSDGSTSKKPESSRPSTPKKPKKPTINVIHK